MYQWFTFKALKEEDPKAALDSFQRVLDLENGEKGEWGFKVTFWVMKTSVWDTILMCILPKTQTITYQLLF